MPDDNKLAPIRPEAARAQLTEFFGVAAGVELDLGDGVWVLPNPRFLPPDMKKRYLEHLRFINHDLDTVRVADPVTGKQRTQPVWPLTYKGAVVDEDELLCIALMGTDAVADREAYFKAGTLPGVYERFLTAGGVAGQVQFHWQLMSTQLEERLSRDPKSR
jgi:hypothetical protein